jgi:hypothetical protein
MTGGPEPAERRASMSAIVEIELTPDADGRVVVFTRHEGPGADLVARLVRPGASFLGLSYERLAAAGAGRIVPDGAGGWRIEALGTDDR